MYAMFKLVMLQKWQASPHNCEPRLPHCCLDNLSRVYFPHSLATFIRRAICGTQRQETFRCVDLSASYVCISTLLENTYCCALSSPTEKHTITPQLERQRDCPLSHAVESQLEPAVFFLVLVESPRSGQTSETVPHAGPGDSRSRCGIYCHRNTQECGANGRPKQAIMCIVRREASL